MVKIWRTIIPYYDDQCTRKRITKSGFRTKKEAEEYTTDFKAQRKLSLADVKKEILFSDYFDSWMKKYENAGVARQTLITHYYAQKLVHEYFKDVKASEITKNVFQTF